ncbi:MAG: DUF4402 domain-containing protein [Ginsengibacter sp.]
MFIKIKKLLCRRLFYIIIFNAIPNISFCQTLKTGSLDKNDAINITTLQNIQFGAFSQGASGGSVIISADGLRSATGSVIPLNFGNIYSQAIFEIEAPLGSVVSLLDGQNSVLTGSNGGSMTLQIDNSIPASPFYTTVDPPAKTQISVGATLTVGNSSLSPPGNYTGNLYVLFLVE